MLSLVFLVAVLDSRAARRRTGSGMNSARIASTNPGTAATYNAGRQPPVACAIMPLIR